MQARETSVAGDPSAPGHPFPSTGIHRFHGFAPPAVQLRFHRRRVRRPHTSTHHPALDAALFSPERYLEVAEREDFWDHVGTVRFFHRPLCEIVNPLADAGFAIERLVEPAPSEAFRAAKPESYRRLQRQPAFLLVLARPWIR